VDLRSKLGLYREGIGRSAESFRHKSGRDVDDMVRGRIQTNGYGSCYLIEKRLPLSFLHGGYELGAALDISGDVITALGGEQCGGLQAGQLLYLDTETTGLSGGAGTLAFLIGTGFFEKDDFVIRQYFMRDYNEETAMLAELQELFADHKGFVTFNGKSFDINLLQSRFISNRFKPFFRDFPNVDLLYPSRRVWGLKLESCRLSSLEESILGQYRQDDIPGAQIPSVYFKYVEDRDASEIKRVISHNEMDILSMVSLLIKLSTMMNNPFSETDCGFELLGMGRLFEANGKTEDMLECLKACTSSGLYSVRMRAVRKLTGVYKRNGSYEQALEYWKAIEAENPELETFHLIEMAKYYEHKAKDPEQALRIAEKAVKNCLRAGLPDSRQLEELKKRCSRLKRKCEVNRERRTNPGNLKNHENLKSPGNLTHNS
jgi:uncharacterized protein YprB with RNaseH-like and TPR domain